MRRSLDDVRCLLKARLMPIVAVRRPTCLAPCARCCTPPVVPGDTRTLLRAAYRLPDAARTFLGCIARCRASFARCRAALLRPLYAAPLCIERCCEARRVAHILLDACQNEQNCADRCPTTTMPCDEGHILDKMWNSQPRLAPKPTSLFVAFRLNQPSKIAPPSH